MRQRRRRFDVPHLLSHLVLSGEKKRKVNPKPMDLLVKKGLQGTQGEGEGIPLTLMTLKLTF